MRVILRVEDQMVRKNTDFLGNFKILYPSYEYRDGGAWRIEDAMGLWDVSITHIILRYDICSCSPVMSATKAKK